MFLGNCIIYCLMSSKFQQQGELLWNEFSKRTKKTWAWVTLIGFCQLEKNEELEQKDIELQACPENQINNV